MLIFLNQNSLGFVDLPLPGRDSAAGLFNKFTPTKTFNKLNIIRIKMLQASLDFLT